MTLNEFLLARIAEDEAAAMKAAGRVGRWNDWSGASAGGGEYITVDDDYTFGISPGISGDAGWHIARCHTPHIARHDPARVLAECEAKRRIVEMYVELEPAAQVLWLGKALELLAKVYTDHPDYREEWKP